MDSVAKVAMQTRGSSARTQAHSVARSTAPPEHEVSVMDETIAAELVVGSGREGVYPSEKRRMSLKVDAVELVTTPTARKAV
ncbi:hypothetical protein PC111_g23766 [Phytophthora cactorum]|nr:hypothetical protein PC111_g23766 [Phytophthora cactorum]